VAGRTRCPGLRQANAAGVWGNHDIGLCHSVEGRAHARHPAAALDDLAAQRPRLVVGECHFSHVEPSVGPYDAPDESPFRGPDGLPDVLVEVQPAAAEPLQLPQGHLRAVVSEGAYRHRDYGKVVSEGGCYRRWAPPVALSVAWRGDCDQEDPSQFKPDGPAFSCALLIRSLWAPRRRSQGPGHPSNAAPVWATAAAR
jgi:hypothetical protein